MATDSINPEYYKGKIEVIDFIESHELGYHEGNIIKYVVRWKRKNGLEDLKKARWYLDRLIAESQTSCSSAGSRAALSRSACLGTAGYTLSR